MLSNSATWPLMFSTLVLLLTINHSPPSPNPLPHSPDSSLSISPTPMSTNKIHWLLHNGPWTVKYSRLSFSQTWSSLSYLHITSIFYFLETPCTSPHPVSSILAHQKHSILYLLFTPLSPAQLFASFFASESQLLQFIFSIRSLLTTKLNFSNSDHLTS